MNLIPPPSSGGSSVIRRIQRDKFSTSKYVFTVNITLNGFTNINKMIVILNSKGFADSSVIGNTAYVDSLTLNNLTIGCNGETTGSYQVIEFY